MSPDEHISLSKAAGELGWKGTPEARALRLKRVLFAKERILKREIVIRGRGPKGGVRYRVTMRLLRKHCREFFVRSPNEMANEFRRHLERIDERIADQIDVIVAPQLEELRMVDEELFSQLKRLAERIGPAPRNPTEPDGTRHRNGHG